MTTCAKIKPPPKMASGEHDQNDGDDDAGEDGDDDDDDADKGILDTVCWSFLSFCFVF